MRKAGKSRRFLVAALIGFSLISVGCYELLSYFAHVLGIYSMNYRYDSSGSSSYTKKIQFNSDGTLTALDPASILGGDNPTTSTWSQDKDKLSMNFAGPIVGGAMTSSFIGTLKDRKGEAIENGTWSATYTSFGHTYSMTGTWNAIKD